MCERGNGQERKGNKYEAMFLSRSPSHKTKLVAQSHGMSSRTATGNTAARKGHITEGGGIESVSASSFLSLVFHWLKLYLDEVKYRSNFCTSGLSPPPLGQCFI